MTVRYGLEELHTNAHVGIKERLLKWVCGVPAKDKDRMRVRLIAVINA